MLLSFFMPIMKIGIVIAPLIEKQSPNKMNLSSSMDMMVSRPIMPKIIKKMGICMKIIEIITFDCMFLPLTSKAGDMDCMPIVWRKHI